MQVCGLVMLLILLVILLREKSLDLSRRRRFLITMISCIVCIVMDILSVVAIVNASNGQFPDMATFIICKIYLVLLVNVGYRTFIYVAGEFLEADSHGVTRNVYRAIFLICIIGILVMPIEYYCEGRIVYSHGPATWVAYSLAVIMLVSTITMAFVGSESTSRRRKRAIIIWQLCWAVAAFIQFMRPDLLVISFAAAFGIVLVYAELENPNEGIDRVTGQFTYNELFNYVADHYRRGEKFSAMHLRVDYTAGNYDLSKELAAIRGITSFLNREGSYVFRESDRDFVVIYREEEQMRRDYERTRAELEGSGDMSMQIAYLLIPDSTILANTDEFMQFQHFNVRRIDAGDCVIAGQKQADEMREYLKIRDQIVWAITNDGIEVYYQPIFNVTKGSFTSAEALVRIRDSENNQIMPDRFIHIAEENGLIVPVGKEVFRQVCAFLAKGEVQKLGIEYIEVNLSMVQFDENEPAGFIQEMMDEYEIDPTWINLEITETADPEARQMVLRNMEILNERGVRFSLDDFGTGRSNLDYFVAMPVDIVKFDYKFTHWYFESGKARYVVESIFGIVDKMGLPTVMEGVETKEELDAMIELGATYVQGFYFSKPIPEVEFIEFLRSKAND